LKLKELARTDEVMQTRSIRGSGQPVWVNASLNACFLIGTRSAQSIMASGFTAAQTDRTHDRTRPLLQQLRKFLPRRRRPHMTQRRHQLAARRICAVSGSRFAAGNLATVGVIAGCHARDIAAEIGVAFSGSSQRCLEVRTQRTGNESKNGCINSGRLVAH